MPSGTSGASGPGGAGGTRGRRALALTAWAGVTAVACAVVWLGVDSVLIPAAETPPAVLAAGAGVGANSGSASVAGKPTAPRTPSPRPSASANVPASPSPSPPASLPEPPPSPSPSPRPSPTSSLARYATAGGVVVLAVGAHSVSLVSATPAAGYSVQNWSAAGWLRVDFDQGSTTYSVFATWNGYSPQVQVVGPGPSA